MTDLEYHVRLMLEAVRLGDLDALNRLCDLAGVIPLRDMSGFQQAKRELEDALLQSMMVPAHLLLDR